MNKELNNAIENNEKVFKKNQEVMEKAFDIDKFNTDLAESIRHMEETCDRIDIENGTMTLERIGDRMEQIEKKMLWDKVCENNRKINLLNDKLDMILKKLGG